MVDELGYLSLGQQGSEYSSKCSARGTRPVENPYECAVCRLGEIFGITTAATAIADRLVRLRVSAF